MNSGSQIFKMASNNGIERPFSTLRCVNTWNRVGMGNKRLSGLCMMSVHKRRVKKYTKTEFIDNLIEKCTYSKT